MATERSGGPTMLLGHRDHGPGCSGEHPPRGRVGARSGPPWRGWTSEFTTIGHVVSAYYPEQSTAIARAITWARTPTDDGTAVRAHLDGCGPRLAAEYERTIGQMAAPSKSLPSG
jgi:hypothetical protein